MTDSNRYRLSPTQEGMLVHALSKPAPGVDIEQMVWVLPEHVDVALLTRSWQETVERHDALRSRFDWTSSPPVREVVDAWKVELSPEDWRGFSSEEQGRRLHELLSQDRQRGFKLDKAPLVRLVLLRVGDDEYRLVWTFHHAILDGRSFTLLVSEVLNRYDRLRRGADLALAPPPPFPAYLDWLASSTEESEARDFWRDRLEGFEAPDPLLVRHPAESDASSAGCLHGVVETKLRANVLDSLRGLSERCGVTLNTVLQAAWGTLLSRYTGASDVVFGATRACRRVPVDDASAMIGVFINTLPMRADLGGGLTVREALRGLRAQSLEIRPFEHTPLAQVHALSPLAHSAHLFETLVVFENYDLTEELRKEGSDWSQRSFHLYEQTNYAVTLYGYAGSSLRLKLSYARARVSDAAARRIDGAPRDVADGDARGPRSPDLGSSDVDTP